MQEEGPADQKYVRHSHQRASLSDSTSSSTGRTSSHEAQGLLGRYVDLERVGPLLQSFSGSAGIASAIIDLDGVVLTQARWQPLCTEFHRRHPQTRQRCIESDTVLASRACSGEQAAIYTCLNGLTDAAAPIVVDDLHLANAFVGQFFLATPDLDFYRHQADQFGFEPTAYLQAVEQVPVLSEPKARAALAFLASSTEMLACMGREVLEKDKAERRLHRTLERLRLSVDAAVGTLARTVEMRDPYTAGHQERVTELALAIGKRLELGSRTITSLRIASLIHDLGKISIPAEILAKPGTLTEMERQLIRQHPETGYQILREMRFPGPVATIVRQHHERCDGSGYPQGLRGKQIRIEARILAVADVVEAMSSHRPYRSALGLDAALQEIKANRGKLYDPAVVDACLALTRDEGFAFSTAA